MSLHYVIDGYNLINHPAFLRSVRKNKDQRAALASLIVTARLCGSPKNKITIVFDGYPPALETNKKFAGIDSIFSRDDSADERIKKIVERSSGPKNIIVVSDDKEIRFIVKSIGAHVLGIEEFMLPLEDTADKAGDIRALNKDLNYSQINSINQELKKKWLKAL